MRCERCFELNPFREKADGRYAVGFFLRLPGSISGAIALCR